jgi:hypothetical protein
MSVMPRKLGCLQNRGKIPVGAPLTGVARRPQVMPSVELNRFAVEAVAVA